MTKFKVVCALKKRRSIYASKLQFKCSGNSVFDQKSCYKELPCKVNRLWQAQMLFFSPNQWLDRAQSDHGTMISTFSALIGKHIHPVIRTKEMHATNSTDHWIAQKINSLSVTQCTSVQENRIIWNLIICHILSYTGYFQFSIELVHLYFIFCTSFPSVIHWSDGIFSFKNKKVDILLSEIIY